MKTSSHALRYLMLLILPLSLFAQTTPTPTTTTPDFGARAGDMEFTLGGSGLADKDIDNSNGGVAASLGYYLNDTLAVTVRQTVNYADFDSGESDWIGSTRLALDQHLGSGRFRPFLGINAGGVYGDEVNDTFVAGLEGGLKFYVQPRTFLFALVDYSWSFDDSDDVDDTFDDGGFQWTVGVGFNF